MARKLKNGKQPQKGDDDYVTSSPPRTTPEQDDRYRYTSNTTNTNTNTNSNKTNTIHDDDDDSESDDDNQPNYDDIVAINLKTPAKTVGAINYKNMTRQQLITKHRALSEKFDLLKTMYVQMQHFFRRVTRLEGASEAEFDFAIPSTPASQIVYSDEDDGHVASDEDSDRLSDGASNKRKANKPRGRRSDERSHTRPRASGATQSDSSLSRSRSRSRNKNKTKKETQTIDREVAVETKPTIANTVEKAIRVWKYWQKADKGGLKLATLACKADGLLLPACKDKNQLQRIKRLLKRAAMEGKVFKEAEQSKDLGAWTKENFGISSWSAVAEDRSFKFEGDECPSGVVELLPRNENNENHN